ncbi:Alpha-tubulin N-acetyltransferase 1 [Linnemannia gamsii]|uniref:Alpha-tubulin N-acetyltransferase n=1 Tax=Linnemannia gamsii TaxID=64522 RepID=A0ABQ7JQZ3_9FUNG|nr:Alpha-tubulin N-acetyltransferase 1 [Linnemannia gamsii]
MDFDFPLIPLLPLPITLVPAATFAALENSHQGGLFQPGSGFASSVSIGISPSRNNTNNNYVNNSASSSFSSSSITSSSYDHPSNYPGYATNSGTSSASSHLSDQERLGAIVDALGEASAKAQELPTSITQRLRLAKNPTQRVYILRTGLDSGEDQWLDQLEIGSPLMQESIRKSIVDRSGAILSGNHNNSHNCGTARRGNSSPDLSPSSSSPTLSQQEESSQRRSPRTRSEEKGVYVAGMLKMGEKKLFIVDKSGTLHEQEVCCVLDFYVDESCQRRGFGKLLFDYMLKVEDIDPCQIAYDRPSPKLYQFLNKYFQLERHLPQPNQFAVFQGFNLLDTGETVKVDDDTFIANTGRSSSSATNHQSQSSVQQQQQQEHSRQQQERQQQRQQQQHNHQADTSTTTSFIPSPVYPATSRVLQSSVVFGAGAGYSQDHHTYTTTTADATQPPPQQSHQHQQQATNRRVSSAFTSSINLSSSPSTPSHQSPLSHQGSVNGTGRISRLLASSIVFTDPTGGNV